jgi:hypothetical protein
MAGDMVFAVYIPPQRHQTRILNYTFRNLLKSYQIKLLPKASNADTILSDSHHHFPE